MTEKNIKQIIARIEKLEKAVFAPSKKNKAWSSENFDLNLNERSFVKRYVVGKSGPRKFTLLVAYLVKGEIDESIRLNIIKSCWNRMKAKSLLGRFNMFYSSEAKTKGWVDSKKYGMYCLTKEWKSAL